MIAHIVTRTDFFVKGGIGVLETLKSAGVDSGVGDIVEQVYQGGDGGPCPAGRVTSASEGTRGCDGGCDGLLAGHITGQ